MKDLKLKKRLTMRPYQETIVSDIVNKFNLDKPYVLGSCPSSGKTEMSIEVIIRLLEKGSINRVLVLAHSTVVLKMNYYERLLEYFYKSDVAIWLGKDKPFNHDALVQVMIPQNIEAVKGQFDLVITDEAHHNVLAESGQHSKIIEMVKPKMELLLTGTPSKFVKENDLSEDISNLPYNINALGMDRIGIKNFHDVKFDLVKSSYNFTDDDYDSKSKNLKGSIEFKEEDTENTLKNVIRGIVTNVALRNGIVLSKDDNFELEARKLIEAGKFGKTLIMCKTVKQSNQVSKLFSDAFNVRVEVSQSENDVDSLKLRQFKNNEFDFMCVVNRAREGYDDNKLVNLIDLTMTHNIDLIYQMFCRVVRKDLEYDDKKLYIKVTPNSNNMPEYTTNIMTAALMLGSTENLKKFNGNNLRGLVTPKFEVVENEDETSPIVDIRLVEKNLYTNVNDIESVGKKMSDILAMDLIEMFSEDNKDLFNGNSRYVTTTLGESLDILNEVNFLTDLNEYVRLAKENGITSGDGWRNGYKDIEYPSHRLHSHPWDVVSPQISFAEFGELLSGKLLTDLNEYVRLAKENGITNGKRWSKGYKVIEYPSHRLASRPWDVVYPKITFTEFGRLLRTDEKEMLTDLNEYVRLAKENGIASGRQWLNNGYKKIEYPSHRLASCPWNVVSPKISSGEFGKLLRPNEKEFLTDLNEYVRLAKENGITSGQQWRERYKNIKYSSHRLASYPWKIVSPKISSGEFGKLLRPNEKEFLTDLNEYFRIFRKHDIENSSQYKKHYREHVYTDYKLKSSPWEFFKQTFTDFFKDYQEWLKDNPKSVRGFTERDRSEFEGLNKKWGTMNSKNTQEMLKKDPSEFHKYHELYRKHRKDWKEIPYIEISKKIPKDKVVGDFGCGDNLLKEEIPNTVHSFDHVSIDDTVISGDMSNTPLEDGSLDIVVYCLSLMGSNKKDYFKEAYRVLKPHGLVFISEPNGKDNYEKLKEILEESGFSVVDNKKVSGNFMYMDAVKI